MIHALKIYSQYADKIYTGTKLYEIRKHDKQIKDNDTVILLETLPDIKIRGGFIAGQVIVESPKNIWEKYNTVLGISENDFFNYFDNEFGWCYLYPIKSIFKIKKVCL